MNKYKNLMSNTLVFAIATFSAKLLPFVLLRFYTAVMPKDEFGIQSLITSACNLILPIMYLSMGEAVIRYGLDKDTRKQDVFTTGILTVLSGYLILLCCMPLLGMIPKVGDYLWLVYLYCLASAMHTVVSQFVRANGHVKLFAFDGIFTTVVTALCNILLLVKFKLGAQGYVLSIIIADALSAILLTFLVKAYEYFKPFSLDYKTVKKMVLYAAPLVPTAVFWWITSLSNRYFIGFMIDDAAVGVYTVSQTLPNLITLVSMIFIQAWQLSAFTEYKDPQGEKFFSTVFKSYYTFVFLASSGLILFCKPIMAIMTAPGYHEAWRYTPFLVLAVAFSTLVTFLGTVYNAVQKNGMVMLTTFIGAGVNIIFNWVLIPVLGSQGAAIATFLSFLVVFIIRAIDCQKYMRISMQPMRIVLTVVLLLAQIAIGLMGIKLWFIWQILIIALIILCNRRYFVLMLSKMLSLLPVGRRQN